MKVNKKPKTTKKEKKVNPVKGDIVKKAEVDPIQENELIIKEMEQQHERDSSDEEEEDEKETSPKKQQKSKDQKQQPQNPEAKAEEKKLAYDKADEARTVFCGNIPNSETMSKSRVKELFTQYGRLKSVRFRSATGNVLFAKKNKKNCGSLIAYVVFENENDAKKSCQLNGYKLLENHLRVNMANDKKEAFSNKGTIFVGNLPFDATEEEVHDYFRTCVGEIEYVRILPKKGIAYVCFKKGVALAKAIKLHDQEFKGRKLRVSRCESKDKQERKKLFKRDEKTGRVVKQRVKKSHKLNESFIKGRPTINNPIIKKIKESQKAKFNKFTSNDQPSKKDMFRRGGKMDKDQRDENRDRMKKKQKFSGSKVGDAAGGSGGGGGVGKKSKKTKVSKTAKQQKVFAKKLKSAAMRGEGKNDN